MAARRVITAPLRTPTLTVWRKFTAGVARYWYYSGGVPHDMSEAIALKEAYKGRLLIKTVEV
jgi:hypothetical protein